MGMSERSAVDRQPRSRPVVELLRPNLDVLLETKLQAPRPPGTANLATRRPVA